MRIVSLVGAATVAAVMMLVGCGNGPGGMDKDEMEPDEMPAAPIVQVFTGSLMPDPDPMNPLMGTIAVTIAGITHDGEELGAEARAGALALLGGDTHDFTYTLSTDMTMITVAGVLLETLMVPEGMVTAARSAEMDPTAPLNGMWTAPVEATETMTARTLTLVIMALEFTLTVDATPASS